MKTATICLGRTHWCVVARKRSSKLSAKSIKHTHSLIATQNLTWWRVLQVDGAILGTGVAGGRSSRRSCAELTRIFKEGQGSAQTAACNPLRSGF